MTDATQPLGLAVRADTEASRRRSSFQGGASHAKIENVRGVAGLLTLTVGLTLTPATPAYAQRQLGAIQGTITDQTGGVLPGVTVTATNKSTGEVRTTTTNEVGIYRLQSLPKPEN